MASKESSQRVGRGDGGHMKEQFARMKQRSPMTIRHNVPSLDLEEDLVLDRVHRGPVILVNVNVPDLAILSKQRGAVMRIVVSLILFLLMYFTTVELAAFVDRGVMEIFFLLGSLCGCHETSLRSRVSVSILVTSGSLRRPRHKHRDEISCDG